MKDGSRIWQKKLREGLTGSRGRAAALLGKFLVFMMVCTLVSRALYTGRMVQVTVGNSRSMSLNHVVEARGTVQKGPESAVLVPEGMRIEEVRVREGQQVEAGDELLLLDCEDIRNQLTEKREQEQRLTLQMEAAREAAGRQAADSRKNRERAQEDYDSAVAGGNSQVDEAKAAWEKARQEREQFAGWDGYLASVQQEDRGLRQLDEKISRLKQELAGLQAEAAGRQEEYPAEGEESAPEPGEEATGPDLSAELLAKEQELAQAQAEREDYLAQLSDSSRQQWEQQKAALEEAERQALRSYEETQDSREQSVQAASRALEDASQKPVSDSSLTLLSMDVENAQRECAALEALLEAEGRICAQQAGQITQVSAETGQRTTDAPAFLLAAGEGELLFQAVITKEQSRYVNAGDSCTISFDSGKRKAEGLTVLSLAESREQKDCYELTVGIPAGQASMGQSGTFRLVQQTANYGTCVPLEALHIDNRQQTYVLVLASVETFLGEELTAVRRPVRVLDKNENYAALEDGSIGAEDPVILSATGIINEGDIVRMEEP